MQVFSTLSNDNHYHVYHSPVVGKPARIKATFTIAGKANMRNENFITPQGVMTDVPDDVFEALEKNEVFQIHVANGYITYDKKLKATGQEEIDKVAGANMAARDESAPLTEKDLKENAATKDVKVKAD